MNGMPVQPGSLRWIDPAQLATFIPPLATEPAPAEPVVTPPIKAQEPRRMSLTTMITSAEHAVSAALHDIVVGARATAKVLDKVNAQIQKEAPTVIALTGLVDPRAAAIERVGVALLGQAEPVVSGLLGEVSTDAEAPSIKLTAALVADLRTIFATAGPEISLAKAQVVTAAK